MRQEETTAEARVSQREAVEIYNRLSGIYDLFGRLAESKARRRALELAVIRSGQHVLEVAVGTGLAFVEVVGANPEGRNVGIDLSPGMLAQARKRLQKAGRSNFELSEGSALAIDEADGAFDLVLNSYLLDLLDERSFDTVLGEFRRVLKPGGRLVMVNMTLGERAGSGIYQRLYRLSPALMGGCRGVRMAGRLETSGFVVRSREYVQQMLFPSEVILATREEA